MRLLIRGRPDHISLPEARAWIWGSLATLQFHGLSPLASTVTARFKKQLTDNHMGRAYYMVSAMELRSSLDEQAMFTTILHETIHLCVQFPQDRIEACTSTLCSKFKHDVAAIAAILLHHTYRRAAAIAHCKIGSYAPKNGDQDFYNTEEDETIPWLSKYRRGKPPHPQKELDY